MLADTGEDHRAFAETLIKSRTTYKNLVKVGLVKVGLVKAGVVKLAF